MNSTKSEQKGTDSRKFSQDLDSQSKNLNFFYNKKGIVHRGVVGQFLNDTKTTVSQNLKATATSIKWSFSTYKYFLRLNKIIVLSFRQSI